MKENLKKRIEKLNNLCNLVDIAVPTYTVDGDKLIIKDDRFLSLDDNDNAEYHQLAIYQPTNISEPAERYEWFFESPDEEVKNTSYAIIHSATTLEVTTVRFAGEWREDGTENINIINDDNIYVLTICDEDCCNLYDAVNGGSSRFVI